MSKLTPARSDCCRASRRRCSRRCRWQVDVLTRRCAVSVSIAGIRPAVGRPSARLRIRIQRRRANTSSSRPRPGVSGRPGRTLAAGPCRTSRRRASASRPSRGRRARRRQRSSSVSSRAAARRVAVARGEIWPTDLKFGLTLTRRCRAADRRRSARGRSGDQRPAASSRAMLSWLRKVSGPSPCLTLSAARLSARRRE